MLRRLLRALARPPAPPPAPASPPLAAPRAVVSGWRLADEGLATVVDTDFDVDFAAGGGLTSPAPGLWTGRVLGEVWCRRLRREVERWEAARRRGEVRLEPPNSMHQYGIPLEALGLGELGYALFAGELWARALTLPGVGGPLHSVTGFVVRYGYEGDEALAQHVDDADATLSLCLDDDADGSELVMEGLRCGLHLDHPLGPGEGFTYTHRAGYALLHPGKHRHRVLPIRRGSRLSLILWARGPDSRARFEAEAEAGRCPPWCGARR